MGKYAVTFEKKPTAKGRMLCIPFAGATSAYYRSWLSMIPKNIELTAIEIPGRLHLKETPPSDIEDIINRIYPEVVEETNLSYVIFAHSFGSMIAYELVKKLQLENKPLPKKLFVSSRRAPHIPSRFRPAAALTDSEFIDEIQNLYQAIPQQILKEKDLLMMLLPILKKDIGINETYIGELKPLLNVPLKAYLANKDYTILQEDVEKWKEVTTKEFEMEIFEGGHFFIDQEKGKLISEMCRVIESNSL